MALPETASLLTELNGKSGENLEYDNLYLGLEELAVPVEAQEIGDTVGEGRDADFRTLAKNCLKLWERTRDLRVAAYYTVAACCNEGLEGLHQGLEMVAYLIDNLWDEFYPQLDPDDDNDPTERINILNMLSPQAGAYGDPVGFINHLRAQRLVPELPYTLRDVMIAQGMLESRDEPVDMALVQGQIRQVPPASLAARQKLIATLQTQVADIVAHMNERLGSSGYLNCDTLLSELKHFAKFFSRVFPMSFVRGTACLSDMDFDVGEFVFINVTFHIIICP